MQIWDLVGAHCGTSLAKKVRFSFGCNQGRIGEEMLRAWFWPDTEMEHGIRQHQKLGVRNGSPIYTSEYLQRAELPQCSSFPKNYKQTYLLGLILSQLLTWIPRLSALWIMNPSDQAPLQKCFWKTICSCLWLPSIYIL